MTNSSYLRHIAEKRSIAFAFSFAILFNLLPWRSSPGIPDAISLTLLFQCTRETQKQSIFYAFIFGILADVHCHCLLGEHILRYLIVMQLSYYASRQLREVPAFFQSVLVFPILVLSILIPAIISYIISREKIYLSIMLSPLTSSLIWPLLIFLVKTLTGSNDARDHLRHL